MVNLCIESLVIGYNNGKKPFQLLAPLNASAKKGELISVIGRNGIGKSTLLRTLAGLHVPLKGNIYCYGRNINEFSKVELATEVGYISTDIVKVANMSVYDLVSLGRYPHTNWFGKIDPENHDIIMDAIEKTSLLNKYKKFITELSDGERQKAMIARLIAQDTGIMIMDEPTAFLDVGCKYEILHLLHKLTCDSGKTVIFSTHDLHMAVNQSDKIWLIPNDKIIEGSPEDLMIEGSFEHLFDSFPVQFNSSQGTFSFRNEDKGDLFVEGDGIMNHWTKKALKRIGYSESCSKTEPYISVPSEKNKNWMLNYNDSVKEFYSIYELTDFLKRI
jgi:iron complex transport system ATP-binding protein